MASQRVFDQYCRPALLISGCGALTASGATPRVMNRRKGAPALCLACVLGLALPGIAHGADLITIDVSLAGTYPSALDPLGTVTGF
jgi:hypothetical protein